MKKNKWSYRQQCSLGNESSDGSDQLWSQVGCHGYSRCLSAVLSSGFFPGSLGNEYRTLHSNWRHKGRLVCTWNLSSYSCVQILPYAIALKKPCKGFRMACVWVCMCVGGWGEGYSKQVSQVSNMNTLQLDYWFLLTLHNYCSESSHMVVSLSIRDARSTTTAIASPNTIRQ